MHQRSYGMAFARKVKGKKDQEDWAFDELITAQGMKKWLAIARSNLKRSSISDLIVYEAGMTIEQQVWSYVARISNNCHGAGISIITSL